MRSQSSSTTPSADIITFPGWTSPWHTTSARRSGSNQPRRRSIAASRPTTPPDRAQAAPRGAGRRTATTGTTSGMAAAPRPGATAVGARGGAPPTGRRPPSPPVHPWARSDAMRSRSVRRTPPPGRTPVPAPGCRAAGEMMGEHDGHPRRRIRVTDPEDHVPTCEQRVHAGAQRLWSRQPEHGRGGRGRLQRRVVGTGRRVDEGAFSVHRATPSRRGSGDWSGRTAP